MVVVLDSLQDRLTGDAIIDRIETALAIRLTKAQVAGAIEKATLSLTSSSYEKNVRRQGIIWRRRLLKDDKLRVITRRLTWLFNPWFALFMAACLVSLISYDDSITKFISSLKVPIASNPITIINGYLIAIAILTLHELGHATALHRFGSRTDGLGLGIFLIFPFAYTDVTRAWSLSSRQRACVDLGGVYFQIVATLLVAILYSNYPSPAIPVALSISIASFLFAINPFMRNDGYWLLADILDDPDLKSKSYESLANLTAGRTVQRKALAGYAIFDIMFTVAILLSAFIATVKTLTNIVNDRNYLSAATAGIGLGAVLWGLIVRLRRIVVVRSAKVSR